MVRERYVEILRGRQPTLMQGEGGIKVGDQARSAELRALNADGVRRPDRVFCRFVSLQH